MIDKNKRQIIAVEDLDGPCFRWCRRACWKCMCAARASIVSISATASCSTSIRGRGRRLGACGGGGARRARAARRHRPRELRQAFRRQGAARGAADRGHRLGDDQGPSSQALATAMAADDSGPLRGQDDEVAARAEKSSSTISATRWSRLRSPPIRPARATARRCRRR